MALEESIDGLEKMESNGVTAWIDKKLKDFVTKLGRLTIDYRRDEHGGGYVLTAGDGDCSGGCDHC